MKLFILPITKKNGDCKGMQSSMVLCEMLSQATFSQMNFSHFLLRRIPVLIVNKLICSYIASQHLNVRLDTPGHFLYLIINILSMILFVTCGRPVYMLTVVVIGLYIYIFCIYLINMSVIGDVKKKTYCAIKTELITSFNSIIPVI